MSFQGRSMNRILLTSLCVFVLFTAGCAPRVTIATGTTIGLKATPGDGNTRPPQVTFGYKRAETALIPTKGKKATDSFDAFSTLAAFFFTTQWFEDTEIVSFIATGHAARNIQKPESKFNDAFASATLSVVSKDIQARRMALMGVLNSLNETQSRRILDLAGYPAKPGKTAKDSLQDAIKDAQTDLQLVKLESAFQRVY